MRALSKAHPYRFGPLILTLSLVLAIGCGDDSTTTMDAGMDVPVADMQADMDAGDPDAPDMRRIFGQGRVENLCF